MNPKLHICLALGASGPLSEEELLDELIRQCPGVSSANAPNILLKAIKTLHGIGIIEHGDPLDEFPTWDLTDTGYEVINSD
jgi:hypothetical protein